MNGEHPVVAEEKRSGMGSGRLDLTRPWRAQLCSIGTCSPLPGFKEHHWGGCIPNGHIACHSAKATFLGVPGKFTDREG